MSSVIEAQSSTSRPPLHSIAFTTPRTPCALTNPSISLNWVVSRASGANSSTTLHPRPWQARVTRMRPSTRPWISLRVWVWRMGSHNCRTGLSYAASLSSRASSTSIRCVRSSIKYLLPRRQACSQAPRRLTSPGLWARPTSSFLMRGMRAMKYSRRSSQAATTLWARQMRGASCAVGGLAACIISVAFHRTSRVILLSPVPFTAPFTRFTSSITSTYASGSAPSRMNPCAATINWALISSSSLISALMYSTSHPAQVTSRFSRAFFRGHPRWMADMSSRQTRASRSAQWARSQVKG
mmetsp:Transcript_62785/g.168451  ORF Transcript_62785/g.168451 Transcript_62785/m.168451 type:complete len:297 (+) Transcript_62785:172-1062(+)